MDVSNKVTDGHIDLPIYIRYLFNNHISEGKFPKLFEDGGLPMHLDLPRLRSGQSGGAFWSVFVECPKDGQDISTENQAESESIRIGQMENGLLAADTWFICKAS